MSSLKHVSYYRPKIVCFLKVHSVVTLTYNGLRNCQVKSKFRRSHSHQSHTHVHLTTAQPTLDHTADLQNLKYHLTPQYTKVSRTGTRSSLPSQAAAAVTSHRSADDIKEPPQVSVTNRLCQNQNIINKNKTRRRINHDPPLFKFHSEQLTASAVEEFIILCERFCVRGSVKDV